MRSTLALVVMLSGCGVFKAVNDVKEKVRGLTNPLVGQGLVLGSEQPSDPSLVPILEAAQFDPGTSVNLFLADSSSASGADDAPVEGARVTLRGSQTARVEHAGDGLYVLNPADGPPYEVGQVWELTVDFGDDLSALAVELPPAAEVAVPEVHPPLGDLVLDFTGLGFQSALVFVLDGAGTVTWTNEPQTTSEAIDFAGNDDDLELLIIPGTEAFPSESVYAVGIAGLRSNDGVDIENMNTALSNLQAGKLRWFPTSTLPLTSP